VIIDSSAVAAILLKEPGYDVLQKHLAAAEWTGIGAPTVVESALVLSSRVGLAGKSLLARFIHEAELEIVALTAEHWTVAADAFIRYGKGRHPAVLNFGDCLTYAVCKVTDEPLLSIGDDFPATDLSLVESVRRR
jgi:ribonuclease VapC